LIPWLNHETPFPPAKQALASPNGLLAAGGDLSPGRLLQAYRNGIFPWFNSGEPILWWSPDPRMVLFPAEFRISRSLRKALRNKPYEVRADTAFEEVIRSCAAPRRGHQGTWITQEMIRAYCELHRLGHAHSVEVWMAGVLVGGLYGVGIGRMFFAESMFSRVSNGSKIALAHLAVQLHRWQQDMAHCGASSSFPARMDPSPFLIDCQMYTPHLASLGAREISRSEFIQRLQELVNCDLGTDWQIDTDLFK
jgi:leucyl/phenylalanyl-tRNA--protein transferase